MRLRYRSFVSIVVTMRPCQCWRLSRRCPTPYEKETIPGAIHIPFRQPPGGPEGYPQGPHVRVHVRQRDTELASCEARGGPGIPGGLVLSDRKLEGGELRDGTW
jgi:hypothetical protein